MMMVRFSQWSSWEGLDEGGGLVPEDLGVADCWHFALCDHLSGRDNPSNPHNLRLIKCWRRGRVGGEKDFKRAGFPRRAGFLAKQLNTFLSLYER